MKLDYYKSEKGIYVANHHISYLNRRDELDKHHPVKINGKQPQKTHHVSWLFVEGETELKSLSIETTGEICNYRWELKDSTPELVKKHYQRSLLKSNRQSITMMTMGIVLVGSASIANTKISTREPMILTLLILKIRILK